MNETSVDDLQKAIASFLICLGSTLPRELAQKIATRMLDLSHEIEHGGDTNPARLTKCFAEALLQMHPPAVN